MTLGQLVDAIKLAIYRQEGEPADSTNPGNLIDCPWFAGNPPILTYASDGSPQVISRRKYPNGAPVQYKLIGKRIFWNPPTRQLGDAGAGHVLALHIAEGQTLEQAISSWAPESDENNTPAYIANVAQWASLPTGLPLANLIGSY